MYTHIAQALARGCIDLYYVNTDTGEFVDFHTDDRHGVLTEARRGKDFFESCKREAREYIDPEDRESFIRAMDRKTLTEALEKDGRFELTFRRIADGKPLFVKMTVTRMQDDRRFIVIAVSDIDELMKQRQAEEQIREERVVYARLHALTGNFIRVYVVDPQTDSYREFSATDDYTDSFAQAKDGTDFFRTVREATRLFNHPDDLDRFLTVFTKENVMAEI